MYLGLDLKGDLSFFFQVGGSTRENKKTNESFLFNAKCNSSQNRWLGSKYELKIELNLKSYKQGFSPPSILLAAPPE
jgi:hypothetical protein